MNLFKKHRIVRRKETIDKSADPLAETLKMRLDYLTFEASDEEFKPDELKKILAVLDERDPLELPKGIGEKELLARFNRNNRRMIKREERKSEQGTKWYQKGNSQIAMAAVIAVLFMVPVIKMALVANNDRPVYEIIRENDKEVVIEKKKVKVTSKVVNYPSEEVTLEQLKEKGFSELYLPVELLQEPSKAQLEIIVVDQVLKMLSLDYRDDSTGDWTIIGVSDFAGKQYKRVLGDEYRLPDPDIGWENERAYYDDELGVTQVFFEAGGRIYDVKSNLPSEEVFQLIRSMEEC